MEAGTVGCWGGHNGPDNQPAECLSFFPQQGVSVETERWSLLMVQCVSSEQTGDKNSKVKCLGTRVKSNPLDFLFDVDKLMSRSSQRSTRLHP